MTFISTLGVEDKLRNMRNVQSVSLFNGMNGTVPLIICVDAEKLLK